jgi:hypothetical protein
VQLQDRGGLGWLNGFDEWLCRCGLSANGPPGEDVHTSKNGQTQREPLTLHGRIANQPAHHVEVRVNLDAPHEISVIGQVEEGCLFFPHLALTTTYSTIPGSNRLVIHDVVENRLSQPAELQLLYHCNVGPPLLEAGSRVVVATKEMAPQTPRAAEGIETFDTYAAPCPGFTEQVYCFDPLGDHAGKTMALLYNAATERGMMLHWNRNELPCFTLWKNTGALEDGYVTGLEPGTNFPNFKTFERAQGRVPVLAAGGRWECTWGMEFLAGASAVSKALAEIVALQAHAKPLIHRQPHARFSVSKPDA